MTLKPGYCKVNRKTFKKHHTYTKHSEGDTYIYIATLAAFQSHQGKELTQVFLKKKKKQKKNTKPKTSLVLINDLRLMQSFRVK